MKRLLSVIAMVLTIFPAIKSQEFLLHEESFTWTENANSCGGYHYWYDYGEAPSMNWTNPYDYKNGQYYFRFEIIDQPSNEPCQLNFCIWSNFDSEECAGLSPVLNGPGSVATFNSAMNFALNGGIDWTDLTRLSRFGNPLWVNGHNFGPSIYCTDHPEEWVKHLSYFPMTIRITIVAVAAGYSFSGWDNYLGGNPDEKQPTPNYGIDYGYEQTNKVVPSTDEYSYNSNMSGAVSGNGQRLHLTPGTDVYFRTKAGNGLLESDIQHLVVPLRPSMPSFTVDFINEKTMENAGSDIGYSTSPSFNDPVNGTGDKISLIPGQDLYLWKNATSDAFASFDYHLVVPDRPTVPTYQVYFASEKTVQTVVPGDEYSIHPDLSGAISGTDVALDLTPGTDLYFRTKATGSSFCSDIQHMIINPRPDAPLFFIDYENEITSVPIENTIEYSFSSDMTAATNGTGTALALTAGQNLYFRVKFTDTSFCSLPFFLEVPEKPVLEYSDEDTITSESFTITAILDESMSGFDLSDILITNGYAINLQGGHVFDVIPESEGEVHVIIPFNTFNGASFASNVVIVFYDNIVTGISDMNQDLFRIYPNPSKERKITIQTQLNIPYQLSLYSIDGSFIKSMEMTSFEFQQIDVQELQKGIYFLKIKCEKGNRILKLVLD